MIFQGKALLSDEIHNPIFQEFFITPVFLLFLANFRDKKALGLVYISDGFTKKRGINYSPIPINSFCE